MPDAFRRTRFAGRSRCRWCVSRRLSHQFLRCGLQFGTHGPSQQLPFDLGGSNRIDIAVARFRSFSLHHLLHVEPEISGPDAIEVHAVRFRSEEHTSELQSLMRISYAVFFLKKKTKTFT